MNRVGTHWTGVGLGYRDDYKRSSEKRSGEDVRCVQSERLSSDKADEGSENESDGGGLHCGREKRGWGRDNEHERWGDNELEEGLGRRQRGLILPGNTRSQQL